jgi:excisionase family DNA binding protein
MALRDEDLLTVVEVATILHVHKRTVQRWIADGKLEAVKLPGGRYRIRSADAEALLRKP